MAFVRSAVRVRVPASSANLGPGFDSLGLALDMYDEVVAMVSDDAGVLVEVSGEGEGTVALDASHLVATSMARAFDALGARPAGFVLRCTNTIPHGRGLGSSAAAIVGGLVLARGLVEGGEAALPDEDLLQLALAMEDHPDNIAAALYGGMTIGWLDDLGRARTVRRDVHPDVAVAVAVPSQALLTHNARAVLPASVALGDAVFNVSRSALLVHALTTAPELLLDATDDRLHQRPRRAMYPSSMELVDALRAQGVAAVISGAGPSVLALGTAEQVRALSEVAGEGWTVHRLAVAGAGAHVVT